MRLIYEGTDITGYVQIRSCTHSDASGGKCDMLDIELENARQWMSWKPQPDDVLEAREGKYRTGALYLNTIIPDGDKYRIIATSLKSAARRRAWQSFNKKRLRDIIASCAAQCGMEWYAEGIDLDAVIPFIARENEGCPAFLDRLMRMEGATLKTVSGRLACIGIEFAQGIEAVHTVEIRPGQRGVSVCRREELKCSSMTVSTPYAKGAAIDTDASWQEDRIITDIPAMTNIQAKRWALGLLINNNRAAEQITIQSDFDAGMTAMARVNITGQRETAGEWLVDETVYDLKNKRTAARLNRCIWTVK